MADHIPLVTSVAGARIVNKIYKDSKIVRVSLTDASRLMPLLPNLRNFWIDPCMDGYDNIVIFRNYENQGISIEDNKGRNAVPLSSLMSTFPSFDKFLENSFIAKPIQAEVDAFVAGLLDKCKELNPAWITVPQLPLVNDKTRNKINRSLAKATGKWKSGGAFHGRLIFPLIFTHKDQLKNKTARNPNVQLAEKCYHYSQADGFWVVEKGLNDESGSRELRNNRFPNLIALHEELNQKIASNIRLGGPYWGLNLVLWSRGLIEYPVIGVGSGYEYFLSGGHMRGPSARVAISSLRRRALAKDLDKWLSAATKKLDSSHPARKDFVDLLKVVKRLSLDKNQAREQVAKFYKGWFDSIAKGPSAGRSLGLFQDLSTAYALGKLLPPIDDEKGARRPEVIAEYLMLNCL